MSTPTPNSNTTESFKFDTTNRIVTRDSDGEVMAKLDAANVLTFTHQSREKNYGVAIRALLDAAGVPFAEPGEVSTTKDKPPTPPPAPTATTPPPAVVTTPPPAKKAKEKAVQLVGEPEPPRDPSCGSYSREHLLWDYKYSTIPDFLRKWAGDLTVSTKRTVQEKPDFFGDYGDDIIALLDAAPRTATAVPGTAADFALLIRGRVADFMETEKPPSKEGAVTALSEFIAELVTDPAIRARL